MMESHEAPLSPAPAIDSALAQPAARCLYKFTSAAAKSKKPSASPADAFPETAAQLAKGDLPNIPLKKSMKDSHSKKPKPAKAIENNSPVAHKPIDYPETSRTKPTSRHKIDTLKAASTKSEKRPTPLNSQESDLAISDESIESTIAACQTLNALAVDFVPMDSGVANSRPAKGRSSKQKNDTGPSKTKQASIEQVKGSTASKRYFTPPAERKPTTRPGPDGSLSNAELQASEVECLSKRFSASEDGFTSTVNEHGSAELRFSLPIVDPDFPFEIESIRLLVTLPVDYPKSSSPEFQVMNADIPEYLCRNIEIQMNRAARGGLQGELSIRPMLRWLEKNVEIMLKEKESGIKFLSPLEVAKGLKERALANGEAGETMKTAKIGFNERVDMAFGNKPSPEEDFIPLEQREKEYIPFEKLRLSDSDHKNQNTSSRFADPELIRADSLNPLASGTQLLLKDVTLFNISLSICTSLSIMVTCARCKKQNAVLGIRADGSDRLFNCHKCTQLMQVAFWPDYVHTSSRKAGIVSFVRCEPFDLLPSTMQIMCGECEIPDDNPLSALKCSVKVSAVKLGEPVSYSCRQCHSTLEFCVEAVEWVATPISLKYKSKATVESKPQKLGITIGQALPLKGACKHYAKSYRWFRFPCCGKLYPCDVCHDEAKDLSPSPHKAAWATRMVCGFCAREQPFSQKPCPCGATLSTASAKKSAFWEGGKGMRDTKSMSKKDSRKYRNTEAKTKAKSVADKVAANATKK